VETPAPRDRNASMEPAARSRAPAL
jgi:hypothetical protein